MLFAICVSTAMLMVEATCDNLNSKKLGVEAEINLRVNFLDSECLKLENKEQKKHVGMNNEDLENNEVKKDEQTEKSKNVETQTATLDEYHQGKAKVPSICINMHDQILQLKWRDNFRCSIQRQIFEQLSTEDRNRFIDWNNPPYCLMTTMTQTVPNSVLQLDSPDSSHGSSQDPSQNGTNEPHKNEATDENVQTSDC